MSLSREQMREQMIDYLYGELQGEALARFEATLAESEQSRRELAALQATLHAARAELARDTHAQPPARVRDAVLQAAHAQLAAARNLATGDAARPAYVAQAQPPRSQPQPWAALARALRWLRSVWILPSLVAATAAALLVFRHDQHTVAPDTPTASISKEVSQPPTPSSAAEPAAASEANTARPDDSSSDIAAPRAEAPARPARQRRTKFATPPADWQRSPSADTEARAPTSTHAAPPRAPESEAATRGASSALKTSEASDESATLSDAPQRTAAPAAADPSAPNSPTSSRRSAELRSDAVEPALPTPLTAARLERRAREHAAATRWAEAVADYRELLRRFPQDPRRKLWTEQLELALRAAAQPAPNN